MLATLAAATLAAATLAAATADSPTPAPSPVPTAPAAAARAPAPTAAALATTPAATPAAAAPAESFLEQYAATRRFQAGRPAAPRVTPDGKEVLFLRSGARSPVQTLFALDVATAQTRELLTADALLKGAAETLSAEEKARLERQRVTARGFTAFDLSPDGQQILVSLSGRLYLVARATGAVRELATGAGAPIDPQFSPDGRAVAYVRGADLYVLDVAANAEHAVTTGGTDLVTHGLAEFVAQEEMGRMSGFWWAPDGRTLAYTRADHAKVERFLLADPMHPEAGGDEVPYPRAGTENADVTLGLVSASGGPTTWVTWDRAAYPYLASVVWPKQGPLTLLVQARSQRDELLLEVDPATGETLAMLQEEDAAWVNLDQDFPRWVDGGRAFLWLTERHGGPEVELRARNGKLRKTLVPRSAGFVAFAGWDEKKKALYFTGAADAREAHVHRVVDGGKPERLAAAGPAWQSAKLSEDGARLVVTTASLAAMPRTTVWSTWPPKELGVLPSVAEEPDVNPAVELRDVPLARGASVHALVVRPRVAAPAGAPRLPVIVEVYGGPTAQLVRHSKRELLLSQWLADQGFVVFKIDGRGTPRRGSAWERAVVGDFSLTLPDQAEAVTALCASVPEADCARVGVYGWSFGGYLAALAVMRHPDVFKAAVAGAPVVDWRDYDTHYTERYLGLPAENPGGYERSSLLTYARELTRPLLLVHGTVDDNVYFLNALKLSDALFKAGVAHEFLPLSGFTHMVPDPVVTVRLYERIVRHFRERL